MTSSSIGNKLGSSLARVHWGRLPPTVGPSPTPMSSRRRAVRGYHLNAMRSTTDPPVTTSRTTVGRGADLSAQVTVFVTTVGAASFGACMAHLEAQDAVAQVEVIEGVAPLQRALQLMLDRCTTPYFVQVDEDMLLEPDSIRRLYELMGREWPNVAILVGQLHDDHLGRPIEGVKLHRLEFVGQFPWSEYRSVLERNDAIVAAGHRIARRPIAGTGERMTFGVHAPDRTPASIFDRYRHLERLRRTRPDEVEWFADYPAEFLRRVLDGGDEADYYALMGILAAAAEEAGAGAAHGLPPTKDFRRLEADPGVDAAKRFRSAARQSDAGAG